MATMITTTPFTGAAVGLQGAGGRLAARSPPLALRRRAVVVVRAQADAPPPRLPGYGDTDTDTDTAIRRYGNFPKTWIQGYVCIYIIK